MSLYTLQRFLTVYLRNPVFREAYRGGEAAALNESLGLDDTDLELLAGLDLDILDRTADGFRHDRIDKRRGEFSQFLSHLSVYGPPEEMLRDWDGAFPDGLSSRPAEMDRFLTFATEYVVGRGLPEYLIDILRLCYHYTKIADSPVEPVEGELEPLPPSGLRAYHRLRLRGPFHVLFCRYDALALAEAEPDTGLSQVEPRPVRLLIQKDRHRAKRTFVRHLDPLPYVPALLGGEAVQVSDLLAGLSAHEYPEALQYLARLVDDEVVAVVVPTYLRPPSISRN